MKKKDNVDDLSPKNEKTIKNEMIDKLPIIPQEPVLPSCDKERFINDLKRVIGVSDNSSAPKKEEDPSEMIVQKQLDEKQIEILRSMIAEYVKNFVVFGYDMRGERMIIASAKSSEDKDAIVEMSKNVPMVLMSLFNGRNSFE